MSCFYHTEKIEDGSYRINSPENVFSELIVGEEKALLFDTGICGYCDQPGTLQLKVLHGN